MKRHHHCNIEHPGPSLERLNPGEPELPPSKDESGTSSDELRDLRDKLAESQNKVAELNQANSDMEYLLASVGVATFFLDRQMNLTRFTPAAADIFGLTRSDVGLPFDLAGNIDCPSFTHDAEKVLAGHPGTELVVATPDRERCFLLRILPYRTQQGCIDGIMVTLSDITEQKRMEQTLKESKRQVRQKLESILAPEGEIGSLELGDIIDAGALQSLVDDFHELTGMPMSLLDMNGKVLVGVGWQKICTQFHRVHPDTCRYCIESDLQLSAGVPLGEYKLYKCKNNMWDIVTPVMLGDRQLGNLFLGQFFFEDEPLDYQLFRAQARAYQFDESDYLAALEAVPRLSRKSLNTCMTFFMKLAGVLSKLSYGNLKLARSLSERDALMQSLFQSEQRLQLFIEHAPAALAMFDTGMRYLSVSRRWLAAFGLGERDLTGASHYDIFPEITETWREAHRRGLAGEVLRGKGDRFERADGSVQWVRWEIRPWRDAAGEIGGIVIFSDDITELKKAENLLGRYELLAENSREVILFLRCDDGRILEANAAAVNCYGYAHHELLGLTVRELSAPEATEPAGARWAEATSQGIHFETVHRRRDGSTFPVEVSYQWATICGTRTMIGVVRDIVERKRAEAELQKVNETLESRVRERTEELSVTLATLSEEVAERQRTEKLLRLSEERYRKVVEDQTEIICRFNEESRFIFVNDVFCRFFGKTRDELLASRWQPVVVAEDVPVVEEQLRRLSPANPVLTIETRVHTGSGTIQWMQVVTSGFFDHEGRLVETQAVGRDITEAKHAERVLAGIRDQLEQQVKERTHSLTESNEKLQQEICRRRQVEIELLHKNQRLESMAIELSLAEERERDRIAGELHDQVGQRLILGKMKLGALASQVQSDSCLDDIEELDQIIGLSIQDIRSLTFQLRPPLLATAGLEAALRWLGEEFQDRYGHQLSYFDDNNQKPLRFETRSTVFQAAREMLINTVKHAGATHIEIDIRREADMLQLCLSDNGRGFDLAEAGMKKSSSGGFGLNNVQRRIEHLGGGVIIESRPGNGTQITIVVPLDLPQ